MSSSIKGLEIIGGLSENGLSYEFHEVLVWEETSSGKLFFYEDRGCSCPVPFDKVYGKDSLDPLVRIEDAYFLDNRSFDLEERLELRKIIQNALKVKAE